MRGGVEDRRRIGVERRESVYAKGRGVKGRSNLATS